MKKLHPVAAAVSIAVAVAAVLRHSDIQVMARSTLPFSLFSWSSSGGSSAISRAAKAKLMPTKLQAWKRPSVFDSAGL
ncbi:hypothetical protein [Mesorhizobium sp. WSM4310]|uniref:hypothetical protein n=1 Tax=Mesorhizobium sp. WSM4310 TaxID=2589883 RepID=UPI00115DC145|nr:hypothetical protein [Mesorhizobium sp. WSM4310]